MRVCKRGAVCECTHMRLHAKSSESAIAGSEPLNRRNADQPRPHLGGLWVTPATTQALGQARQRVIATMEKKGGGA